MTTKPLPHLHLLRRYLALALLLSAIGASEPPVEETLITISARPQQTFGGFGVSSANPGHSHLDYGLLPAATRQQLARQLWTEGRARILRLWFDLGAFHPAAGRYDLADFERRFIHSRLIADAVAAGCDTLLLAPTNLPLHLRVLRPGAEEDAMRLRDDASAAACGDAIAKAIVMLQQRHGILVQATGVQNEPGSRVWLSPQQFAAATIALRRSLDAAGPAFRDVAIIGPEGASVDETLEHYLHALRDAPEAWQATAAIAGHSYNMALTPDFSQRWLLQGRDYWTTEAGDVETDAFGTPIPLGARHGASLAARALNDIRLGCSHWIWFLGYEHGRDPSGEEHRLIRYTDSGAIELLPTYHFFKLLATSIPVGSTILRVRSGSDLQAWTYGPKPSLYAAAAITGSGQISVQVCNYSASAFSQRSHGSAYHLENQGAPARIHRVVLELDPALGTPATSARITRIGSDGAGSSDLRPRETLLQVTGHRLSLDVQPLELVVVTLQTMTDPGVPAAGGTPPDEQVPEAPLFEGVTITLSGRLQPGTRSLSIDGNLVQLDGSGRFEVEVPVAPGQSVLPVVIQRADGRVIQQQLQLSNQAAQDG